MNPTPNNSVNLNSRPGIIRTTDASVNATACPSYRSKNTACL